MWRLPHPALCAAMTVLALPALGGAGNGGDLRGRLRRHGDPQPYDKRVWRRQDFADRESIGSIYRLHSPDGDQHFPGALDITVTYRLLRKRDECRIEYQATTTAPTVLNLTNHLYLNLAGAAAAAANTLADHRFQIAAERYLETDALRIPSGVLLDVVGTPFDFRRAASVSQRLPSVAGGYDHSLVLAKPAGVYARVATITGGGRRLAISTSEPSRPASALAATDEG